LSSQLSSLNEKIEDLSKELSSVRTARDNDQAQISELQAQIGDNQRNMEREAIQRYNELLG
jgi:peptidoglycan hydrolase CwlO-like protein